jgi:flavorubredoxin
MHTEVHEIAPGIHKLSTFIAEAPPNGFGFNQYLIAADEPLLFHCGGRGLFPLVSQAAARVVPLERLRWICFGHVESDESGAMNLWLAAAPKAQVAHGVIACMVSLNDLADRPPRALADNEVLDLGGKRVRYLDTPHVPHAWESGLMFEETTATLFCGDLFTQTGPYPASTGESIVAGAIMAEDMFRSTALTPNTGRTIRRLAALKPRRLALMHGAVFEGDCASELERLADYYDRALKDSVAAIA